MIVEEIDKNGWSVSLSRGMGLLEFQGSDDDTGMHVTGGRRPTPRRTRYPQ